MAWATCNMPRTISAHAGAALLSRVCRMLKDRLFDRYRPERHYMRGPGPKCREKQGLQRASRAS